MKIQSNSYVSLAYKLTVDGNVIEDVKADSPLEFIFGVGMLLPKFEDSVKDKEVGEKFAFTLAPEEGYGEFTADAVVDLPKNIFEVEGVFDTERIVVGGMVPMMDNQGNQMYGKVVEIAEEFVKMDFNHPMAGQTLNFEGEVVGVRESTEADMAKFMPAAGGCGCGDSCGEGCSEGCGDDQNGCGC